MNAQVLLGISVVIFGIIPIIFGANSVYVFLTLCAGELLSQLASRDVTQIINSLVANSSPVFAVVQIVLLLAAPLVTLVIFRKAIRSPKRVVQIIPAVATALACFILVVAKLPYDMQKSIQASDLYLLVKPYYEFAVAAGLLISVFYLWTKRPKHKLLEDKKPNK
jgi:hypothetical protein